MDCDIHLFVETRASASAPWQAVAVKSKCSWCGGKGAYPVGEEPEPRQCYRCKGEGQMVGFDGRNYDLFAILANVRNGYGFAGITTGEGFHPISEPRGVPEDISDIVRQASDDSTFSLPEKEQDEFDLKWGEHWLGDHSFSWVTLKELLDLDWTQTTLKERIMYAADYEKSKAEGKNPDYYPSPMLWKKQWNELVEEAQYLAGNKKAYVRVLWNETYQSAVGSFYETFMPTLVALGLEPENVRLVFGFDS